MKRVISSLKKKNTTVHAKTALIPFFIITFCLLGFMGYAATHAEELFKEPTALPPGGQPSGIGGVVNNLDSVLRAGANASGFINPVLLGGKLVVPTICFGTSSTSTDCMNSWSGLGGGSTGWTLTSLILQNTSGKNIDVNNQQVKNLAAPTDPHDAIRKVEFDALATRVAFLEAGGGTGGGGNGGSGGGNGATGTLFAYIANSGSNSVSVIDTDTNTVTTTVSVGNTPYGVAVTNDGAKVYVTNTTSNTVSVINTATNTVTATISLGTGAGPKGIAVTNDGTKVYVANTTSNTVSVINTATNTVASTISLGTAGGGPHGIAITPDGARVYVTQTWTGSGNKVFVIDTSTNIVASTIPVGTEPIGIAVTPDGTKVYVANSNSNTVSVINRATNTVTSTITITGTTTPSGLAISPDGSRVYVANQTAGTMSIISTATNAVTNTVASIPNARGIAITPDGGTIYVTNVSNNTVKVIDTSTNSVTGTTAVGNTPYSLGSFIRKDGSGGTPPSNSAATTTIGFSTHMVPHALVTPSDGRPVMAYKNTQANTLEYRRCGNTACTNSSVVTVATAIDYTDGSGSMASTEVAMALGTDGLPIIFYQTSYNCGSQVCGNTLSLWTAKCADLNCTSAEKYKVLPNGVSGPVTGIGIAVGPDSYPALAYSAAGQIFLTRCLTTTCGSTWQGTTNYNYTQIGPGTLADTGVAVGADGRPWISWQDTTSIKVTHCTNRVCSGTNTVATVASAASTPAMTLSSNDRPLIVYRGGSSSLKYLGCGDDTCSTGNISTTIDSAVTGTGSVAIATQDGVPMFAYQSQSGKSLMYARCGDVNCGATVKTLIISSTSSIGNFATIAPGGDGFAFMIYGRSYPEANLYVKCGDLACQNAATPAASGSVGVGPIAPPSPSNATSTVGSTGFINSYAIAVPSDGRPVMAYIDTSGTSYTLQYQRCANISCTSYSSTKVLDPSISSSSTVLSRDTSIALSTDGAPIILYNTLAPRTGGGNDVVLKAIKCNDIDCQSPQLSYAVAKLSPNFSEPSLNGFSIAVGSDSYPTITFGYYYNSGQVNIPIVAGIGLTRCLTVNCSSTMFGTGYYNYRKVAEQTGTDKMHYLSSNGLGISADGRPWLSWRVRNELQILHCADSSCSGVNPVNHLVSNIFYADTTTSIDNKNAPLSNGHVPGESAMALTPGGRAVLAYRGPNDRLGGEINYISCGDDTCSTNNAFKKIDSEVEGIGESIAIAVQGGVPVFAYQDTLKQDLRYARCGDAVCNSLTKTVVRPGNNNDGNFVNIVPGSDGFAFITHGGITTPGNVSQNLHVKCNNLTCQ